MPEVRRRVRYRSVLALTCAVLAATIATTAAATAPGRVSLSGTGYDPNLHLTDTGPAATGTVVSDDIYLAVNDPAGLAAKAGAVSRPGTPGYAHYLSPDQVRTTYQLDSAQVERVRDWLRGAGLSVTQPTWRELRVTGTLAQFATAFGVTYDDYLAQTGPSTHEHLLFATTDLSVPGDLGNLVLDVGASDFLGPGSTSSAGSQSGVHYPLVRDAAGAKCSQYWGQLPATGLPKVNGTTPSLAPCGYTPSQLRHAYGLDGNGLTGTGQTVAVLTPSMDTLEQDVNTWSAHVGVPKLGPGQLTVVPTPDGSPPATPNGYGFAGMIENTLDVEAVHGMAPGANIISMGLSTAEGTSILESLGYLLDHTSASIVSASLGFAVTPGMRRAFDQVFQEGALQGVGFYFASGDGGYDVDTGDYLNPASSSDWETSVGGTSLAIGPDGKREWETGWGDGASQLSSAGTSWQPMQQGGGAGGGWAIGQPEPRYQHDAVPDSVATGPDGKLDRVGPDVAMDADGSTGMLVGGTPLDGSPTTDPSTWHYVEEGVGGTSLATPLFAGVQALAQQARGGKRIGFANPIMYERAHSPAFQDVIGLPGGEIPTTVRYYQLANGASAPVLTYLRGQMPVTPPSRQVPSVGPGFDTETGIGTPTGRYPFSLGGA